MKYWITDLGESLVISGPKDNQLLERYGVWSKNSYRNKLEVIEVSNDLDALTKKYGVDPAAVIKIDANGQKS